LRDSLENTEARAAWLEHDRRLQALRQTYNTLKDDPRYTDEHKSEQMWAAYERESAHIQAAADKARKLLEQEAQGHEMMSVPRPKGERVTNLSAERLIAAQNEAARIARKVGRLESIGGPQSLKPPTSQVLKDEYARGIEVGGVEGVAICKGALMAADELGISEEEFLDALRTPEQHELLDKAWRARLRAQHIGGGIPEPPLAKPGAASGPSRDKLFLPRNRPMQFKGRAPSWR
jgi:hypothetical protein